MCLIPRLVFEVDEISVRKKKRYKAVLFNCKMLTDKLQKSFYSDEFGFFFFFRLVTGHWQQRGFQTPEKHFSVVL